MFEDENYENNQSPEENEAPQEEIKVLKKKERNVFIIKPENNSGMGEKAPATIAKKFNWGAFLFNWIWAIRYKKWILLSIILIAFIPFIGPLAALGMAIWAGINGNQWAWEEIMYKNEKDFNAAQQSWVKAWFNLLIAGLVISGLVFLVTRPKKEKVVEPIKKEVEYTVYDMPSELFSNTTTEDNYYNLITTDKYVVFRVQPKNETTLNDKEYLEQRFESNKNILANKAALKIEIVELIDKNGELLDIKDINLDKNNPELEAKCTIEDGLCIEKWLYETCNTYYCILNPQTKKYIKLQERDRVIPQLIKYVRLWG